MSKSIEEHARSLNKAFEEYGKMQNTRAITPEQKAEVLARLLEAWKRHPKQRLGQLLWNANSTTNQVDLFYVEDYELLAAIEEF